MSPASWALTRAPPGERRGSAARAGAHVKPLFALVPHAFTPTQYQTPLCLARRHRRVRTRCGACRCQRTRVRCRWHFLDLAFGGRHLAAAGRPLHTGFARYFGCGAAVACFVWEPIGPAQVRRSDASRAGTAAAVLLENVSAVLRFTPSCHVRADIPMVCSPAVWRFGQTKANKHDFKEKLNVSGHGDRSVTLRYPGVQVQVPGPSVTYSVSAQQSWLRGEVEELIKVRTCHGCFPH